MNETGVSGKSLVQQLLDYRNRAEQLRIVADDMCDGSALIMLCIAASYDSAAETAQAILMQTAELVS